MREFNVSPPNLGGVPKSAVIQLVIESDFNKWILGRWLINLSLVGRNPDSIGEAISCPQGSKLVGH